MSWRCTCCMEIYGDNEICPSWEAEQREHREQEARAQEAELEALRKAANAALAHVEGRRNMFSTRDPRAVARILRNALGDHVNEDRGRGVDALLVPRVGTIVGGFTCERCGTTELFQGRPAGAAMACASCSEGAPGVV